MKHFWLMLFVAVLAARLAPAAQAAEPIKIGFSMELTGPFARRQDRAVGPPRRTTTCS
jgi:ABC-type sugar transport system substrate-binding protein